MYRRAAFLSVMMLFTSLPANAERAPDDFGFAQDIRVQHIQHGKNIVCFYCSVQIDGILKGNAVVLFGDLKINGKVSGNVVDIFGNTAINGALSRNVTVIGGNLSLLQDAVIGNNAVVLGGKLHHDANALIANDEFVVPCFYFLLQLLLVLGIMAGLGYLLFRIAYHNHKSTSAKP